MSAATAELREPGAVLVVSCYELGRQPVAAATALAELTRAQLRPAALDVSVEALDEAALAKARFIAISVPMHTALRLGVRVAERARAVNPGAHVAMFGLYAALNREHLLARHCDSVVGGESDEPLRSLAESLQAALDAAPRDSQHERDQQQAPLLPLTRVPGVATRLHPQAPPLAKSVRKPATPQRSALPLLGKYARLDTGAGAEGEGEHRLVAAVEASRGCLHLCRHCPIVPVYRGRFVAVPRETVLADIAQQVAAGAQHVTFGDPDFLNGPTHALKLVRELHARWPSLTFDATVKIEHLLAHRALLPALAGAGCLFLTSAIESLNDAVLATLDKGHTAADVPLALSLVRAAGIDLRPTLLPYTPWAKLADLPALFDFAEQFDLVDQIDPVQYTLRLLIPPGSAILELPGKERWLRGLDAEAFGWRWQHEDARVDALCAESAALAQAHAEAGRPARETFLALRGLAERACGLARPAGRDDAPRPRRRGPRLTEPWFC